MHKKNRSGRQILFDILLVLEAAMCLTIARLALMLPFRYLSSYLGQHMQESPEETIPRNREQAYQVVRGIHYTFLRLPWQSTCLVQAIAGMMMLKRRGQESTLYIGIGRENEAFGAHAWLRSGEVVVTGGAEKDNFKVLSSFMQPAGAHPSHKSTPDE